VRSALAPAAARYCDCPPARVPIIELYRGETTPVLPDDCDRCGRPFEPGTIRFVEVTVCNRQEVEEVERLNRENGYA
jgi:hypothetical protein